MLPIRAVLVGYLAGRGVKLGAGRARGTPLQLVAVAWAVLSLVVAKYFIFAHFFIESFIKAINGLPIPVGYGSSMVLRAFFDNFSKVWSGYDILWVILAVGAAYRVPKGSPHQLDRV